VPVIYAHSNGLSASAATDVRCQGKDFRTKIPIIETITLPWGQYLLLVLFRGD